MSSIAAIYRCKYIKMPDQKQNTLFYSDGFYSDGTNASLLLMRDLSEATPNSSQRSGLVKANSPAVSYNREKRRDSIQDL